MDISNKELLNSEENMVRELKIFSKEDLKSEFKTFTIDSKVLRVGIISDTQLPYNEETEDGKYRENLRIALKVLKKREVQLIIMAGDIGELGTAYAFESFKEIFNEVYQESEKPPLQLIMGNHDYWSEDSAYNDDSSHIKVFKNVFNQSPWTHYVVNGIHFIGVSPQSGNMERAYDKISDWLEGEVDKAYKANPNMPIFITNHSNPKHTCYGSDDWGDDTLNGVLSKYSNIVDFSGHSHYSLLDERSIWQGEFTAINTQSLSYIELEEGKENGSIPANADKTPMGYVLEISDSSFSFIRINFAKGEYGYEEKSDKRWTFPIPYSKEVFRYTTELQTSKNTAPKFISRSGSFKVSDNETILIFDAAIDDDFVHSYKIQIINGKEQVYFSDFYNGIDDMSKKVCIQLKNLEKGKYNIKIFALDSYGLQSNDYIEIENVLIR